MRKQLTILFILSLPFLLFAQKHEKAVSTYFEQIRTNEASLRYFFQKMPKGADLHHHYSGSVYAETYLKAMEDADLWVKYENEKAELLVKLKKDFNTFEENIVNSL